MFIAHFVLFFQLVFLIGFVLALVGQIGRRVFADNSCWHCRYDLSAHPGVPSGPYPVVCSECGESISDAGMLQVNKQVPRSGMRRLGLILMLAIVPVIVVFIRADYSLDPYRVATNQSIIGLIGSGDLQANEEFRRRYTGGHFSKLQLPGISRKIAAKILAIPQDRIKPGMSQSMIALDAKWGEVYLDLFDQGMVTKEEAQKLFRGITDFSLQFPPHNRAGDPFFWTIEFHGHSVSAKNIISAGLEVQVASLRVGDIELSSMPITRPKVQLSRDYDTINRATTLATAWAFGVSKELYVFDEALIGSHRVHITAVVKTANSVDSGFTAELLNRAHGGMLEFEIGGVLIVQPENDRESMRSFPNLAEVIEKYGTFDLGYGPNTHLFEFGLTIDKKFKFPEDMVIAVQMDQGIMGAEVIGWKSLIMRTDRRRGGTVLSDDSGAIEENGGMWVVLKAIKPYPRDQAWRPLIITGDTEPVWVPLNTMTP